MIPFEQAVAKIRVASEARKSSDFLIVARTDARTALGLEEALRRARAFAAAGADVLFVEAPESEQEMEVIGEALRDTGKPLLVNCVEGGKTPLLTKQRYIEPRSSGGASRWWMERDEDVCLQKKVYKGM